jgi:hypothetical protein
MRYFFVFFAWMAGSCDASAAWKRLACSYNLLWPFPGFLFSLVAVCCFSGVFLDGYKGLVPSSDLSVYIFFVFVVFQHCYF